MGKVYEALHSLRGLPEAVQLQNLLERNMQLPQDAREQEAVGTLSPTDTARLCVIRSVFDGGPDE